MHEICLYLNIQTLKCEMEFVSPCLTTHHATKSQEAVYNGYSSTHDLARCQMDVRSLYYRYQCGHFAEGNIMPHP